MLRRPRSPTKDRLVNARLICMCYLQIGFIQMGAGFLTYFTIMADHGYRGPDLFGIRIDWDDTSFDELEDSHGQQWVSN